MASGDLVGIITLYSPPPSTYAINTVRQSASTPPENFDVWVFDDGATSYLDLKVWLRGYGDGGLTVTLVWMAETLTSGTVRWGAALRRIQDDLEDLDSSHSYDFNTTDVSPPSAAGEVSYDDITFTHGADMDSVADEEIFWLRIQRDVSVGGNMADPAQLFGILITET